jgi:hypothetical protein
VFEEFLLDNFYKLAQQFESQHSHDHDKKMKLSKIEGTLTSFLYQSGDRMGRRREEKGLLSEMVAV